MLYNQMIAQAAIVATATNIDCLAVGVGYGSARIRIHILSCIIINIVGNVLLGISIALGALLSSFLSADIALTISIITLVGLGLYKITSSIITIVKNKKNHNKPELLYNNLSYRKSIVLGFTMSIDNIAVGISASIASISMAEIAWTMGFSLAAGLLYMTLGNIIGTRISKKVQLDLSYLSGVALIIVAILRMFFI